MIQFIQLYRHLSGSVTCHKRGYTSRQAAIKAAKIHSHKYCDLHSVAVVQGEDVVKAMSFLIDNKVPQVFCIKWNSLTNKG